MMVAPSRGEARSIWMHVHGVYDLGFTFLAEVADA